MQVIVNYRSALEGFSETVCVLSEMMAPHISHKEEDTGYHLHALGWDQTTNRISAILFYSPVSIFVGVACVHHHHMQQTSLKFFVRHALCHL